MANLIPVQTHPAGDVEIKTKIVCTPEIFKALITQNGKVFQLSHISYEPLKDSAILTWVPQLPVPYMAVVHAEKVGGCQ